MVGVFRVRRLQKGTKFPISHPLVGLNCFQVMMDIVTSLEHRFYFRFPKLQIKSVFWLGFVTQREVARFGQLNDKRKGETFQVIPFKLYPRHLFLLFLLQLPRAIWWQTLGSQQNVRRKVEVFDARRIVAKESIRQSIPAFDVSFESLLAALIVG